MLITRSQVLKDNQIEQSYEDRFLDDEDNVSVADHYQESLFGDNDGEAMRSLVRDHERLRKEQGFIDMNRQIRELTKFFEVKPF